MQSTWRWFANSIFVFASTRFSVAGFCSFSKSFRIKQEKSANWSKFHSIHRLVVCSNGDWIWARLQVDGMANANGRNIFGFIFVFLYGAKLGSMDGKCFEMELHLINTELQYIDTHTHACICTHHCCAGQPLSNVVNNDSSIIQMGSCIFKSDTVAIQLDSRSIMRACIQSQSEWKREKTGKSKNDEQI